VIKRHPEPLLWVLFSAGGVMSAMLMPILMALFGLAIPLGWIATPSYEHVRAIVSHPLTRLILFALSMLSLFHWAHRFRYTLYDGLQIKHLNELVAILCYGSAVVWTALAAVLLWRA
jgi:succinate dehydrogenase subunit D